jgi:hypothetical protein
MRAFVWIATATRLAIFVVLLFIAREVQRTNVLLWLQYTIMEDTVTEEFEYETLRSVGSNTAHRSLGERSIP